MIKISGKIVVKLHQTLNIRNINICKGGNVLTNREKINKFLSGFLFLRKVINDFA